ncbi:MAG TPA: carbamoyltransferase HypF [Acidobacteriaceae bacterium]
MRQGMTHARRRLVVRGVVQGVGFRPYVYRLASRLGLSGFVRNTSAGAVIEIEGAVEALDAFAETLPNEGPPLMRLIAVESSNIPLVVSEPLVSPEALEVRERLSTPPAQTGSFAILPSDDGTEVEEGNALAIAGVPADIAACAECLAETRAVANRRYEYPFTNCTNCGPRYSIIRDVPYDRAQTTMEGFAMCEVCRAEYDNPADRRFHAQPNACPVCGPHLWLTDACGKELPVRGTRAMLETVVNLLRLGGVVAWKGLGGYQLVCDAHSGEAVRELRRRKHRNEKAFAVMVRDVASAGTLCEVSEAERTLLMGAEKPIVLLQRKTSAKVVKEVAPGSPLLGVMLPYTPMHDLLFRLFDETCGAGSALVMTSGNMSEEPIVKDEAQAQETLHTAADLFVHHNRPIHTRVDDSVARVVEGAPMLLRRARGYAPATILLTPGDTAEVLACGAQQKNTLCLTRGGFAILSQHLGDLENYETLVFFEQTLERMQRLFQVSPQVVAHDMHPGYLSTQFAKKLPAVRLIAVQHHHAHIASCMAEHGLEGPVIGIAWDGTGYGLDGSIWGGEFLVADLGGFTRFAHFRNIPLAGGDAAVRQPWRAGRSYLLDAFDNVVPRGLLWQSSIPESSIRTVDALLGKRIHTFETSSCGRLFDAVASLLGLHHEVSFEGQAAMALEAIADGADEAYDFTIEEREPLQVDMRRMVRQIVDDLQRGDAAGWIAARFHNTLVAVVVDVCSRMRRATGLSRVCLSGGCFQNVRLLCGCLYALRVDGFEVFFQQQVPANDGGIALGQAAIACEMLRRGV